MKNDLLRVEPLKYKLSWLCPFRAQSLVFSLTSIQFMTAAPGGRERNCSRSALSWGGSARKTSSKQHKSPAGDDDQHEDEKSTSSKEEKYLNNEKSPVSEGGALKERALQCWWTVSRVGGRRGRPQTKGGILNGSERNQATVWAVCQETSHWGLICRREGRSWNTPSTHNISNSWSKLITWWRSILTGCWLTRL